MAARTRKRTARASEGSKAKTAEPTPDGKSVEEKLRALHMAGHAVAMYRLGYDLGTLSIEQTAELRCVTRPEREIENVKPDAPDRRARLERYVMALYAGSAAERMHAPYVSTTFSEMDHDDVHILLDREELGDTVVLTWCAYLWERTYAFILDPRQRNLVAYFAKALLGFRTISGKDATFILKDEDNQNKTHSTSALYGKGSDMALPWHRQWLRRASIEKRETVAVDLSPLLRDVLKDLPKRAWNGLELANIRTAEELALWSRPALRSIRNMGRKTAEAIVQAAGKAGITLAPDDAPYPWTTGEERR